MIRYLLVCTTVVGFLILSIPLILIELLIGIFSPRIKDVSSLAIVNAVFRLCLFLSGARPTVIGLENVPKDKAVLYICNHQSFFDILLTYVRVPRPTGYVAKLEMKKMPLLNVWMIFLHCLFLDRANIKEGLKVILKCIEKVKSGISICIFPEGTRCRSKDEFLPFHAGSFKIATKTGCPIIPVSINNTSAIFEDQFPIMKKTHVILEYGTPIILDELSEYDQKHIDKYTENIIKTMYDKNKELI